MLEAIQKAIKEATTDLDKALGITSYLQTTTIPSSATINDLLKGQNNKGDWPAAAYCLDPTQGQKTYYNGSPALSTAFCLEALANYA